MKNIYLDNGATSFPKAPGVAEAMSNYIINIGSSINRGAYSSAFDVQNVVFETRELLCELFNFDKPENVIFTSNITESLNVITKGLLKSDDHVIVSSLEHNALMRPLHSLSKKGVEVSRLSCDIEGTFNPEDIVPMIKDNTRAIFMTHASNLSGTILPLKEIGKIAKKHGLFFIIDAAQSAGFLDIDMKELNCDALCFTGHKSLLGPQGIGGFLITDELAEQVTPLIEGGTGSKSDCEEQPSYMPDKFESGTPNIPGIYGLNASLKHLNDRGLESIREHELMLTKRFMDGLSDIEGLHIVGTSDMSKKVPVVSLDFTDLGLDNSMVSFTLSSEYGLMHRPGLHCTPTAHKTFNTFPQGVIRFSFGYANTVEEIDYAIESINNAINNM